MRDNSNELKIKPVKDYFVESLYIDAKGEERPEYLLTRQVTRFAGLAYLSGARGVIMIRASAIRGPVIFLRLSDIA